ncbi:MAG TPA: hypothetical protein VFP34_11470, partial [Microlunatus sp.]|nr:hypothetical protein [Microlunatus sp.]
ADDPTWHLGGAASVLRDAWPAHPEAVEKVIAGAGFELLANRMAQAQQAGLDAGDLLETIDPDKIAAANVPSPAGITAAALAGAAAEAQIPPWTDREYGRLTDQDLAGALAEARAQLEAATADHAAAARQAEVAAAGRGPAAARLDRELAELRRVAEELSRHSALQADWQSATRTAAAAAAAAALAAHDRDQLGTPARRRRAELDARITELHQQEADALAAAAAAADLASALERVPKDQIERIRIAERIATAEARHHQRREQAVADDIESARKIAQRAEAVPERGVVDRLDAEIQTRARLSPHRRQQEHLGREAEVTAAASPAERIGVPQPEYQPQLVEPTQIVPSPPPSVQQSL